MEAIMRWNVLPACFSVVVFLARIFGELRAFAHFIRRWPCITASPAAGPSLTAEPRARAAERIGERMRRPWPGLRG